MDELQRLVQIFSTASGAGSGAPIESNADEAAGFGLGYEVTPINLATMQPLAKPQLLSGPAAMATHALLMKIHSTKLVSEPMPQHCKRVVPRLLSCMSARTASACDPPTTRAHSSSPVVIAFDSCVHKSSELLCALLPTHPLVHNRTCSLDLTQQHSSSSKE